MPRVLLSLALIAGLFDNCLAIKCMECVDIPNPSFCNKVVTCSANSSCLIRHYVTTSLAVLYSSGCVSNMVCEEMAKQADEPWIEDSVQDMTVCTECCHNKDFCNLEGCGQKATPLSQRGPYCYECSVESEQFGCRNVKQCASDESCYLNVGNFPGTYRSGCMKPTMNCSSSGVSTQHRRWLNVHLPFCCTTDFCNDITTFVDSNPQPVDGAWSSWNYWSGCSKSCGTDSIRSRIRYCDNPVPQHNGTDCIGLRYELENCQLLKCPVNGSWSSWSNWSACSRTCGASASRLRNRLCDNPAPQYNGYDCEGNQIELQDCNHVPCPVNGSWSSWSNWSACSRTCGTSSSRLRNRLCDNPSPQYNGQDCEGNQVELQDCSHVPCPVDGQWSTWHQWSTCSQSCGSGSVQTRKRLCDNPAPQYNGTSCQGTDYENKACNTLHCPVNGSWSSWSDWSDCSKTCGASSVRTRLRMCDNPVPKYNGAQCKGPNYDVTMCNLNECPVNGSWSPWSSWGSCSHTCGITTQNRYRTCNNPAPLYNGSPCGGSSHSVQYCPLVECPVNGGWSSWSSWSSCSHTCGSHLTRTRNRQCDNPKPQHNGLSCVGNSYEHTSCHLHACPVNGGWSSWSGWSSCSHTCGSHVTRTRNRQCDNPQPQHNGLSCVGNSYEHISCNLYDCPVNGRWSVWTSWSSCSHTCGSQSTRTRHRSCNNPTPKHNGLTCHGSSYERTTCHLSVCPGWSSWSSWSACVGPCHRTRQYRFRDCRVSSTCPGDTHQSRQCTNPYSCSDSQCKTSAGFKILMVGSRRLCVYLSQGSYSWPKGRDRCKSIMHGDDLVSIANRDEDYAIRTFLQGKLRPCEHNPCIVGDAVKSYAWIGLYSTRYWVDPDVPYTYNAYERIDTTSDQTCGLAGGTLFEGWHDVNCYAKSHYICEIRV